MSASPNNLSRRPRVCLVGEHDHPDFAEAVALIRRDANLTLDATSSACPELVIVAQSRPDGAARQRIDQVRRSAPIAGVVALLGSWCEGQARASRPTHEVPRLYWYQFAPWWRRQMALRNAGQCPDWARPEATGSQLRSHRIALANSRGVISLNTQNWETADALADALQYAGLSSVWEPPSRIAPVVRGITAGIWDGGQLNDRELEELTAFCRRLKRDAAPVVALLDFPRRDRCELARQAGVAAVLGKPWSNADLLEALEFVSLEAGNVHVA